LALTFPNRSRSYDEAGQYLHFLGYDGMFEMPCLIEIEALANAKPEAATAEAGYLATFDASPDSIRDVARKVYSHGRKNVYQPRRPQRFEQRTSKAFPVGDRLIPATAELCGFDMVGDYVLVPVD
jgi:hypothetical protein